MLQYNSPSDTGCADAPTELDSCAPVPCAIVCMCTQIQASMRGISSLAKETTKLEVGRDATGATVINQYVVVKTLGRGSFGKVKLCLNTIDGQLYAVKVRDSSWVGRMGGCLVFM